MNKYKKIAIILGLLFASLAMLCLGVRTYDRELLLPEIESIGSQSTYELESTDISKTGGAAIGYPVISNAYKFPYNVLYLVSNSHRQVKNNIDGANRLTAKMEAWADSLQITKSNLVDVNNNKQETINNVLSWWNKGEPQPWEIWKIKTYGSWEGFLARYYQLIDKEIIKYEKQSKNEAILPLVKIRQNIYQNQQKIEAAILGLTNKNGDDKIYLQKLSDVVFNQLTKRIDGILPQPSFSNLIYLPTDAVSQNDFGQYNISLSGNLGCYNYKNNNLDITAELENSIESTADCSFTPSDYEISEQRQGLDNITLNDSNNYITLNYQPNNLIDATGWTDETGEQKTINPLRSPVSTQSIRGGRSEASEEQQVINPDTGEVETVTKSYFQTVTLESTKKYYFRGFIPTEKPSVVEIRAGKTMLFSYILPESENQSMDQLINLPSDNSTPSAEIKLTTLGEINPATVNLQLNPIYEPTIVLTKSDHQEKAPAVTSSRLGRNNYIVTIANVSVSGVRQILNSTGFGWKSTPVYLPDSNQTVFVLRYFLSNLLFLSGFICLLTTFAVFGNVLKWSWLRAVKSYLACSLALLVKYAIKPIKLMGLVIYQVCLFLRSPLLLIAFVGIVYDIFFLKSTSDSLIIILWLLWLGTVIGWQLEGRFSFLLALVFLIFCPFLLIGKNDAIAEKSAIWTYMFLLAGTLEQIIEFRFKNLKLVEIEIVSNYLFFQSKRAWRVYRTEGLEAFVHYVERHIGGWFEQRHSYIMARLDFIEIFSRRLPWLPIGLLIRLFVILFRKGFIYIYKTWFTLLSSGLVIILFSGMSKEVSFYENFFEDYYLNEILSQLLPFVLTYWFIILLISLIVSKLKWYLRGPVLINALILLILGNNIIFSHTRSRFEFFPFILRLSPDIAENWNEVKIIGRNFNNLPFKGKVLIDGVEQRTVVWSNKVVSFIVDPSVTKTGKVVVMNDYGSIKDKKSNSVLFTYYDWKETTQELRDRYWKTIMDKAKLNVIMDE